MYRASLLFWLTIFTDEYEESINNPCWLNLAYSLIFFQTLAQGLIIEFELGSMLTRLITQLNSNWKVSNIFFSEISEINEINSSGPALQIFIDQNSQWISDFKLKRCSIPKKNKTRTKYLPKLYFTYSDYAYEINAPNRALSHIHMLVNEISSIC